MPIKCVIQITEVSKLRMIFCWIFFILSLMELFKPINPD